MYSKQNYVIQNSSYTLPKLMYGFASRYMPRSHPSLSGGLLEI